MENHEIEPFCGEHSFAEDVLSTLSYINRSKDGDFSEVAILCDEDLVEKLLKVFLSVKSDDFNLYIQHLDFDVDNYDGEYAVVLSMVNYDGIEITLSVEKAQFQDGSYKFYKQDYVYVDVECSDELIEHQAECDREMDIFLVGDDCSNEEFEEDTCDGDCENCEYNGEEMTLEDYINMVVEEKIEEILG